MSDLSKLLARADELLAHIEKLLPAAPVPTDWKAIAFRWRKKNGRGVIEAVRHVHRISLSDL